MHFISFAVSLLPFISFGAATLVPGDVGDDIMSWILDGCDELCSPYTDNSDSQSSFLEALCGQCATMTGTPSTPTSTFAASSTQTVTETLASMAGISSRAAQNTAAPSDTTTTIWMGSTPSDTTTTTMFIGSTTMDVPTTTVVPTVVLSTSTFQIVPTTTTVEAVPSTQTTTVRPVPSTVTLVPSPSVYTKTHHTISTLTAKDNDLDVATLTWDLPMTYVTTIHTKATFQASRPEFGESSDALPSVKVATSLSLAGLLLSLFMV